MKRFIFEVTNNQTVHITIHANTEEEAREKLEDFDIVEEYVKQDDYYFDEALIYEIEDIDTTLEDIYE